MTILMKNSLIDILWQIGLVHHYSKGLRIVMFSNFPYLALSHQNRDMKVHQSSLRLNQVPSICSSRPLAFLSHSVVCPERLTYLHGPHQWVSFPSEVVEFNYPAPLWVLPLAGYVPWLKIAMPLKVVLFYMTRFFQVWKVLFPLFLGPRGALTSPRVLELSLVIILYPTHTIMVPLLNPP